MHPPGGVRSLGGGHFLHILASNPVLTPTHTAVGSAHLWRHTVRLRDAGNAVIHAQCSEGAWYRAAHITPSDERPATFGPRE